MACICPLPALVAEVIGSLLFDTLKLQSLYLFDQHDIRWVPGVPLSAYLGWTDTGPRQQQYLSPHRETNLESEIEAQCNSQCQADENRSVDIIEFFPTPFSDHPATDNVNPPAPSLLTLAYITASEKDGTNSNEGGNQCVGDCQAPCYVVLLSGCIV